MLETKLLISYIAICVTYSICRLHYLITIKSDEDFNSMLDELVNLAGTKKIIITLVILQIVLSPITAPLSITKQIVKRITNN